MFEKETDWKEFLSEDSKQVLSGIFEAAKKHRCAYLQASDVKHAQLWSAIIELKKEIGGMNELLKKIEAPFRAIIAIGEAEKKKAIEKFVSEIIRPEADEEKVATQKLVESLMRF